MTKEESIAYVQAQAVAASIKLMAMSVANAEARDAGQARVYTSRDFFKLSEEFCITHDAVLSVFKESL